MGTWGGFVFINMNTHAEPLAKFLDVIPEHLAPYNLEKFRVFKDYEIEFNTNWKTAVDAFIEIYHVHSLHPELLALARRAVAACPTAALRLADEAEPHR